MTHDNSGALGQHTEDELHLDLSESAKYAARISHSQASEKGQYSQQATSVSASVDDPDEEMGSGSESPSVKTALLSNSKNDRYDEKVMYEFGGPWGVLLIMILSHVILYYFFLGQNTSYKSALPSSWKDTVGRLIESCPDE